MGRRTTSILVTLSILVLAVAVSVPLSRAQIVKISNSILLLPQKVLSLSPKVLRGALLRSPSIAATQEAENNGVIVGASYHNDTSPPLSDMKPIPVKARPEHEANENPKIPHLHVDAPDGAFVQDQHVPAPNVPTPILNFDGIPFPGVVCNCAPPDTNGEVGLTQYVQIVNEGFQVFDKVTGASVFGPVSISSVWSGFGGVCETNGDGDPVVIYDQLANRWVISQFAGASVPTDECIAVSTTANAAGPYNRYGFHLGTNFFDYPKIAMWPDAYYMSMNVFNSSGTAFLGPQPFAFDRTAMLAGAPATFVSTGITGGPSEDAYLPCDLDGSNLPPAGAPNCFVEFPGTLPEYKVFHFHADFAVPANSTFTLFANPAAAPYTALCPATRSCVPQLGSTAGLDAIADRFMFRMAYRNFGDHESVVGNYTVSSNGVAGIRWIELRDVTAGPVTLFQESTYQPDSTWRWMGSVAMDVQGNMMLGFSASDATINPQIRYAGRLASDPVNVLAQGEGHLFDGTGSQLDTVNRWGDYSDITVDPVDDCTFWYTQEYYATTSSFNWRTRIGNFKFPGCSIGTPTPTITGTRTVTPTPTNTPTPTSTPCPPVSFFTENFDGVTPPALPAGWTATNAQGPAPLWVTSATSPDTAPNDAFVDDPNVVSDKRLDSPVIAVPPSSATLVFRNSYNLENGFDGGVLEISIAGGAFTDIVSAGGSFVAGGYNGTISTSFGSPIAGRQAWTGNSGGYVTTTALLPAAASGQNIQLRWRMGSDSSVAGTGWRIDTISLLIPVCGATPTNTPTATPTATVTPTPTPCVQITDLSENFDEVTPPALPAGWTAANAVGPAPLWTTSNSGVPTPVADTAPNAAFVDDPAVISDKRLDSPAIAIQSSAAQLTFRQNRDLESGFDGGVLEISIAGGAFTDILAAGGSFVTNGYNTTISSSFGNPLAGRQAWSGTTSGAFVTSAVNLPASAAGQNIVLRWRMGSDSSVSHQGWRIDTISVTECVLPTPTPTDTPTATDTPANTPTFTPTNTPTFTPTNTPTNTPTFTPTNTPTPTPTVVAGNQGCGAGFWKLQQHFDSWCGSYTPNTPVSTVFDTTDCGCNFGSLTFLQALQGAGFGNTLCDAQAKLFQQGVAALLNACPGSGVAYALSTAQIISEVNTALQSCNRTTILNEATRLSGFNNNTGGCPLH